MPSIYYSINQKLLGKPESKIIGRQHDSWVKKQALLTELVADLTARDRGYAIAPHCRGVRNSKNFELVQVLCADIDHGQRFSEVAKNEWVQRNVAFMYTTASHTEEEHRFRVVVVLKTPITDPVFASYAINGMIVMFSGDEACKDISRLYFGNPGAFVQRFDNELSDDALAQLINLGKERGAAVLARSINPAATGAQRSRMMLPADVHVHTERGEYVRLSDVPEGTRLLCPMHADTNSSAFRIHSRRVGIYCSKCALSFYVEGERPTADHSWFDYDWSGPKTFTDDEKLDNVDADPSFARIESSRGLKILNERFLQYDEPPLTPRYVSPFPKPFEHEAVYLRLPNADSDILLIKAVKGGGKTEWLSMYIKELKENGYSVLVISHRRSLIQALCKRLGLNSYIDPNGNWQQPTRYFAVCLDSLHKMSTQTNKYDVVIIDECEQVISHCLSSTLKENRRAVLLKLQHYLEQSSRAVLLDADLSKLTVSTLADMFPQKTQRTYINDWKPVGAKLHIVDEPFPQQIVGELIAAVKRRERVVVCSNSKADVDLLEAQIPVFSSRSDLRCIAITSDNSQKPEIQEFIRDIKVKILDYDLILASPSISTGVDITFPENEQKVDLVVGIFRPLVTTHLEIDQQLLRVRHPKKTLVWVAADNFEFETDPGVIRAEITASEKDHRVLQSIGPDGKEVYLRDEMYDRIYSNVTAMQRASKNKLRELFIEYRQAHGCEVITVVRDATLASLGAKVMKNGKVERDQRRALSIVDAPKLTAIEYEEFQLLDERGHLMDEQRTAMQRYAIEDFYGESISEELITYDMKGRRRDCIRNFMCLLATDAEVAAWDERGRHSLRPDKFQYQYRRTLLWELLTAANIQRVGNDLDLSARIDKTDLEGFVSAFEGNLVALQRVFNLTPRSDMKSKPVRQLAEVLKLIGGKLKKSERDQSGKGDRVIYSPDHASLEVARTYAVRRLTERRREKPSL
ncbi:hypothetical protein JI739_24125 [Ramlibacter sp. AW1]|uniref:Replication origin-binding protein domain-containing protein n=1 Tax=Ramlibacter aurantiacus TaxID=2801330 RepID=A0A937D7L3_9BURK|nr:plasmid replication protein, CyRepA1 family [Ramlibacter aurantiacus]MBL0423442.1 hypothetical protein [Ramlibacter aurantiacus]